MSQVSNTGATSLEPSLLAAIPKKQVALWSAGWILVLAALYSLTYFTDIRIPYRVYEIGRFIGLLVMLVLAVAGFLVALNLVSKNIADPWYLNAFLVALVVFWALFPPAWFFTEYLLVDRGTIELPEPLLALLQGAPAEKKEEVLAALKAANLASTKAYADLAAKFWLAVSAVLATAIGLAKR